MKRRICWPDPDATCLVGGCVHCDAYPYRSLSAIEAYVHAAGMVPNRCGGTYRSAVEAYLEGLENNFYGRGLR